MKKYVLFLYFYTFIFCTTITGMEVSLMEQSLSIPDVFRKICLFTNSLETLLNASETCEYAQNTLFPTDQSRSSKEQVAAYIISNPAMIPSLGNKMYRIVLDNKEKRFL